MCESVDLNSLHNHFFEEFNQVLLNNQHKEHIEIFTNIKSSLDILSDELSELVTIIDKTQETFNQHDKGDSLISSILHLDDKIIQYLKDLPCRDLYLLKNIILSCEKELNEIKANAYSVNIQLAFKDILLPNVKQNLKELLLKVGKNAIEFIGDNEILLLHEAFDNFMKSESNDKLKEELSNFIEVYTILETILRIGEMIDNQNFSFIEKASRLYEEFIKDRIKDFIKKDFKKLESIYDFFDIEKYLRVINDIDLLIWRKDNRDNLLTNVHSNNRLDLTIQLLDNTLTEQLKAFINSQDSSGDILNLVSVLQSILKFWYSNEGPFTLLDEKSKYEHLLSLESVNIYVSYLSSQLLIQQNMWPKLFDLCDTQKKWINFLSMCILILLKHPEAIWMEDLMIESLEFMKNQDKNSLEILGCEKSRYESNL